MGRRRLDTQIPPRGRICDLGQSHLVILNEIRFWVIAESYVFV